MNKDDLDTNEDYFIDSLSHRDSNYPIAFMINLSLEDIENAKEAAKFQERFNKFFNLE